VAADIALATCLTLPEPDFDEAPLVAALTRAGLTVAVPAWDDPAADWSAPITVLRSTWNYALAREAFVRWAEQVASLSTLVNPVEIVRWNSHKSYLLDLQSQGVPIAPTVLVRRGDHAPLADVMSDQGWTEVVIKPAVGAGSFKCMRVRSGDVPRGEAHLRALAAERDVLVQRYLPAVEDYGERALVWIDGELTHSVRKSPRFDDEDEHVSHAMPISAAERSLAELALGKLPRDVDLLYARIDVAPGPAGDPVLMELELLEPSLFFAQGPVALERFVMGLQRRLL